ncbi:sodium/proton antiporter, NhaA family (TC 2.A.33.1.1) [Modicisalibacter ilicicola DSM 19980]|uniref:Na(+)/H(+) antiporter NhaA n=1 Tax=Modicisalibacter ilicicola DSM 19980 TaxID=1121942 RepID=A0A1M5BBI3_9GAMM|nr:Na+/H+ antiporter NhaA [Halomonas ilicicola]SHF39883.1 sodium/proton antiporter, NhaA family (TC 2.A.33.1.1) [Halomonas ilicicola DSM 19980]
MTTAAQQGSEERAAAVVTVGAMVVALIFANTPARELYRLVHHTPVSVQVGALGIDKPLILWINDGLMVFFFLLMGVELKREMLGGLLSSVQQVALPGIAAIGGMLLPTLIYLLVNGTEGIAAHGWAVPTATDIVLALAVVSLFGKRVPPALRVFLMALAVFDDLGAIVIIALFYTERLAGEALVLAGTALMGLVLLNRFRVTRAMPYVLLGLVLWVAVLKSGVHATLAGVVIALAIPAKTRDGHQEGSPLDRTYHDLRRWVTFGVVPVFAFFNAGIAVGAGGEGFGNVFLGVALGLLLGKQLGVFSFAWLAIRLRLAPLPIGVRWWHLYAVAVLAGIGFTMSLFIAGLAFDDPAALTAARQGVLLASAIAALVGAAVLAATLSHRADLTKLHPDTER